MPSRGISDIASAEHPQRRPAAVGRVAQRHPQRRQVARAQPDQEAGSSSLTLRFLSSTVVSAGTAVIVKNSAPTSAKA